MVGKDSVASQLTLNVSHKTNILYLGILALLQPKKQSYLALDDKNGLVHII